MSAPAQPASSSATATHDASGQLAQSSSAAPGATELARQQVKLRAALRNFPDFPIPGINFVDILPLFADPSLHETLISALELQVLAAFAQKPDVIVALDARGFLFGPSLALRLGCKFAPVRKPGKLPGPVETASYKKEYGEDLFQLQQDAVAPGERALVVDDIIATGQFSLVVVAHETRINGYLGGSAQAAGALVEKLGGKLLGFLFILELDFLHGRDKLTAPVHTLLSG